MGLLDGVLDSVICAKALSLVKDYGGIQGVVARNLRRPGVSTGPNLPINARKR
jgi:hypothetical protein